MSCSFWDRKTFALIGWIVLITIVLAMGCGDPRVAETTAFESAEVDFQEGNYEDAMSGYQAFLERYPQSPLAPTVQMRLRSITYEVSSVMETTGSPRPSYHGSHGEKSAPPGTESQESTPRN